MAADPRTRMALVLKIAGDKRCSRGDLAVATVLLIEFYNSQTGRCDPSHATLASRTGMSRRQMARVEERLSEFGYFRVLVRGGTTGRGGPTNSYEPMFEQPEQVVTLMSPVDARSGDTDVTSYDESGDTHVASKVVTPMSPVARTGDILSAELVTCMSHKHGIEPGKGARDALSLEFGRLWLQRFIETFGGQKAIQREIGLPR